MNSDHEIYMKRAILVSLFFNIILVGIKSSVLIAVNSLAIIVDLGISIVGLSISVILYYSVKLANRPADFVHNYGYGKVENVCETLEGVVLIGIALAMSSQSIVNIIHPSHVKMLWLGFVSSAINAALNFIGAYYIIKMANKSASPAIHAEGIHYRLEGFISGIIALSFIVTMLMKFYGLDTFSLYVDPLAALLVSLFIIIPSFKLAKSSFFKLLDASIEECGQMEILKHLSKHFDSFCEFKDLRTRSAGRRKFVEFKIVVPEELSCKRGYEIVSLLEKDIKAGISECEVLIKMEPCSKDCKFFSDDKKCPYLVL